MLADEFDVLIIGAGQGGEPLAKALAEGGRRVALAEERHLGGSCVNFGCTPTKAVLASARVAHHVRRAADYGVLVGAMSVDFRAVLVRAQTIVQQSRGSLARSLGSVPGLTLLDGHASIAARDTHHFLVSVGNRLVRAGEIVLDTGTRSQVPPIDGLDEIDYLCAENWLDRHDLPERLLMIGGGYIGLEMAQFYRRMGSQVVVVQSGGQIADQEEPDVADALQRVLQAEGIEFRLDSRVVALQRARGELLAAIERKEGGREDARFTHVFVATGRKPNTDRLGLDTVGVALDEHGFVRVDEHLRSNVAGIWACGDIRGGPMFTHTSWDDYRILKSQMLGDGSRSLTRIVPYAMFTDPELGRVGLSEQQARDAGIDVAMGRFEMAHNGRAREEGETDGFIKVVVNRSTRRIVGATLLCAHASELVHLLIDVMNADAPYTVIDNAIHIHPTLAEAVQSAVAAIEHAG